MKKRVFVGSSRESSGIADELCKAVNKGRCGDRLELVPWVVAFDLSEEILRSLLEIVGNFDGAVFVVTNRDELSPLPESSSCGTPAASDCAATASCRRPRDNIFFEMGLAFQRLGTKNVVLVRSQSACIGSDFKAFMHRVLPDAPTAHDLQQCADAISRHFVRPPSDASADLGRGSYERLSLIRALISRVLTPLKCLKATDRPGGEQSLTATRGRYERIRVYLFNREDESFDGLVEVGGVADNFRRVRIPVRTDVLSQVVIAEQACLLHRRGEKDDVVVTAGAPFPARMPRPQYDHRLTPHNLPALQRESLSEWLDVPLIAKTNAGESVLVGKMTIDNLHSELRNDPVHLDPTDPELWTLAEKAANIIWRYQHGVGISEVLGLDELQTLAVYNQAFRLEMLDDQLQTVLAEIRQRTQFSRLRLYLTIEKHKSLFDKYIEAATPHKAAAIGETGFWGHVEIGGVLTLFSDLTITTGLDNCTRIVFGPNSQADHEEKEKEAHDAFRRGEPVVFFQDKVSKLPRKGFPYIVQCPVEVFYSAPELDRDTVHEHLDVPILSDRDTSRISNRTKAEGTDRRAGTESDRARKVIGKITIDHKWATEQDVLSALNKDMFNDLIRSCPERS